MLLPRIATLLPTFSHSHPTWNCCVGEGHKNTKMAVRFASNMCGALVVYTIRRVFVKVPRRARERTNERATRPSSIAGRNPAIGLFSAHKLLSSFHFLLFPSASNRLRCWALWIRCWYGFVVGPLAWGKQKNRR